jgi:hypothetical protein
MVLKFLLLVQVLVLVPYNSLLEYLYYVVLRSTVVQFWYFLHEIRYSYIIE